MTNSFSELVALAEKISRDDTIPLSQIPNIDLYMDQVTTFMEEYLAGAKRSDEDKIITKTMVNNYTKDKVLPPPVKKKYTKAHTILLIMVYHLKQSLSMQDIAKLTSTIGSSQEEAEAIYSTFIQMQKLEKENLNATLLEKFKKIEEFPPFSHDEKTELLLLVLSLIIDANIKKQLACQILDKYFSKPASTSKPQK